jgi:hypothetical protein
VPPRCHCLRPLTLLAAALLLAAAPALAQRTDVVTMANGDRVTCEINTLDRGILEVATDSWGTISIEWEEIDRVTSPSRFEIQLRSGRRIVGSLEAAQSGGQIVVGNADVRETFAIPDIVFMKPVADSFWRQFDGGVDVGYSFTSAGDATQWSLSFDALRRREGSDHRLSVDSFFASKEGTDDTNRHTVYLDLVRQVTPRWGVTVLGQAQKNDELSLRLRGQAGAGVVRTLVRSNRMLASLSAGVVYNHEVFTDDTPDEDTWELVFGNQFEWFVLNRPKTQITSYFLVFPSLTTLGRTRLEVNSSVRRELLKDFFFNLSVLDSFDSRPPSEDAQGHDLTILTSLGWSF